MPSSVLAAAIQMTSTVEVEKNLDTAERLIEVAARRRAHLVGLPENFAFLRSEGEPIPQAQTLDGPWVRRMVDVARRHELTLLLGSLPERIEGDTRVFNTSVLLGPDGGTSRPIGRCTCSTSTSPASSTSRNRGRSGRARPR